MPLLAQDAPALIELATVGQTTSTDKYFKNINLRDVRVDPAKASSLLETARQSISREMFFPIKSDNMQPGIMKGYRFDEPKTLQPFAVVGTDPLSVKWLHFRREKLAELRAPIYVVEAESFELIQAFAAEFKPLKFVPSSGDGIGKELNIGAYPFLVTSAGVFQ